MLVVLKGAGDLASGMCDISDINEAIAAPGTDDAVKAARDKIVSGDLQVFAGPLKGTSSDGKTIEVAEGERKHLTANWLYLASGYYDYDEPFDPGFDFGEFEGQVDRPSQFALEASTGGTPKDILERAQHGGSFQGLPRGIQKGARTSNPGLRMT